MASTQGIKRYWIRLVGWKHRWARSAAQRPGSNAERYKSIQLPGLKPVSTDAVGTAVMGYANPRAARETKPFHFRDNHILLAEKAGVGTADMAQIDVRGLTVEQARCPFPDLANR